MRHVLVPVLAIALLLAGSETLNAQVSATRSADGKFELYPTGRGCFVAADHYDQLESYEWDGACTADGLITGEGVLRGRWRDGYGRSISERHGRAVDGLMHGRFRSLLFVESAPDYPNPPRDPIEGFTPPAGYEWDVNSYNYFFSADAAEYNTPELIAFRDAQLAAARASTSPSASSATSAGPGAVSASPDTAAVNSCIDAVFGARANGATPYFTNTCAFAINFEFCNSGAREGSSAWMLSCEGDHGGMESIGAGSVEQPATKTAAIGGEDVSWFGCRAPLTPSADFDPAQGRLMGRCQP